MKIQPLTLLIKNASQILTLKSSIPGPRAGRTLSELAIIEDGAVAVSGNKIVAVGRSKEILKQWKQTGQTLVLDAKNKVITPGLVDCHTHLVFAESRAEEFEQRISGKSYLEIARAGGGIKSSVHKLREASAKKLIQLSLKRLDKMLSYGTTTAEAKSGYGLSTEAEIKTLQVIQELNKKHTVDLVPTFLGAHDFPPEYQENKAEYIRIIKEKMIPEVAKKKLAIFCDVFCEKTFFDLKDSEEILRCGAEFDLKPKLHADELSSSGGAELAAKLEAASADHLVFISEEGIKQMAREKVIAVLLPGTSYFLDSRYAPARKMIEQGVPIALATDFNPGSCACYSMSMIMNLACVKLKMTPAEALVSSTLNSSYAINRGFEVGSLEEGKRADILIWEVRNYKEIPYYFGANLVQTVIKNGKVVHTN